MRIQLASIFVDDQDKARAFYTEVLGFRLKTDMPYGERERWLTVVSPEDPDGPELLLSSPNDAARAFQQATYDAGKPTLSLSSSDCVGEAETLKAKGVRFTLEPTSMPYGGIDAMFDDRCGNLINLHQEHRTVSRSTERV